MAAERSLEDFDGPRGDTALAKCLLGWRCNAYERAGYTLLKRNKALLAKTLLGTKAPEDARATQGVLLALCDQAAAVPILCETVPRRAIVDKEMFEHIARLGQQEHRQMIEALPSRVRDDQREMAKAAEKDYLKRVDVRK